MVEQVLRSGHSFLSGKLRKQEHFSGLIVAQMVQQASLPTVDYWKCYTGWVNIILVLIIMLWWKIIPLIKQIMAKKRKRESFITHLLHVYVWKGVSASSVTFDFACTVRPLWGNSPTRYDLVYSNSVSTFYLSPAGTSAGTSKNIIISTDQGQTVPNLLGTQLIDVL